MRFADRARPLARRRSPDTARLWMLVLVACLAPAVALAHERWVPNTPRFPINRAYFQSMSGEVLLYSLGATFTVFGVILLWYLSAPGIVESLTPVTPSAQAREARRGFFSRTGRATARLLLDGDVNSRFMSGGRTAATFFFGRIPAFVLALGAYQGWLVMPSYPVKGDVGDALRIISAVLALWVLTGLFWRVLGGVFLLVYGYLVFAYGIVAIDAIPVLASAFFYLLHTRDRGPGVNSRQLMGIRISLGVGFFLLGLINKIYLHDIFIGVGDQHPEIVIGPQEIFPGLTREAWSFTTAVGEMVFGLLLLVGVFNRITTAVLTFVFANFILVFGDAEIVHVYPIAGFVLLFFRGTHGTSLDGLVFRSNHRFWHWLRHTSPKAVYSTAVSSIAAFVAAGLMFVPLLLITDVVPYLAGTAVAADYKPPPPAPPAKTWAQIPAPTVSPSAKPHADHNPQHGGVVTMVGDHHVEIVVLRDGTILLYPTDAVRKPIALKDVKGTVRIQRAGLNKTVTMAADASGALIGNGPAPTVTAEYTYQLTIRGVAASMTLAVPPGGTSQIGKTAPVKGPDGGRK